MALAQETVTVQFSTPWAGRASAARQLWSPLVRRPMGRLTSSVWRRVRTLYVR